MERLPEIFTTRQAFDILKWQGSRQGLSRHLQADGFTQVLRMSQDGRGTERVWVRPVEPESWECGSDREIAQLALLLVERNHLATAEALKWVEGQIIAAGPRFCREMTERLTFDEVPF